MNTAGLVFFLLLVLWAPLYLIWRGSVEKAARLEEAARLEKVAAEAARLEKVAAEIKLKALGIQENIDLRIKEIVNKDYITTTLLYIEKEPNKFLTTEILNIHNKDKELYNTFKAAEDICKNPSVNSITIIRDTLIESIDSKILETYPLLKSNGVVKALTAVSWIKEEGNVAIKTKIIYYYNNSESKRILIEEDWKDVEGYYNPFNPQTYKEQAEEEIYYTKEYSSFFFFVW